MNGKLRNMTSVYLKRNGQMLMLYRRGGRVVSDVWVGSAGGHLEQEELNDAKACVLRELYEELGLTEHAIEGLSLRYITLRNMENEIRQNYYFFAELKADINRELTSTEGDLRWVLFSELASLSMPFTAQYVVKHYLAHGAKDDKLYCGIADGDGVTFMALPKT